MRIIDPSFSIQSAPKGSELLCLLERAARTCYKSEDKITETSAETLIRGLLKSGHHSVIEHAAITVRFTCDRGVTHELVRHRLCSFSQESTRYANYAKEKFGNEITVIRPFFFEEDSPGFNVWKNACLSAENAYLSLIQGGASPQEARSVLPNSLKTEIVVTANPREWRHIFDLRCSPASHPQMRQVMLPLLEAFHQSMHVLFDDLFDKYQKAIETFPRPARNDQ